ncbi:MAG: DUF883 family protein [Reyranella sp.]|jgi:ElaB/YqjD/DUF883 family membrane-anchored ribosome-binding protein|nr:DUF883 family protein [Reyranella sp.]MBL6650138.1 DUF883 family protein [Reyranella sp.]
MEDIAMAKTSKDTFGYLGTERMEVRELLGQLATALEEMAKAEGAEAIKTARETARRLAREAESLVDDFAAKAEDAKTAASEHRDELEGLIRERPWVALSLAAAAGFLLATLVRR